jgi:hypothetical protein
MPLDVLEYRGPGLFSVFTVATTEDSVLAFDATVYTIDALPFALSAELEIHVKLQEMSYREILREMIRATTKVPVSRETVRTLGHLSPGS